MLILGLNHDMHISSAALVDDGRLLAGAAEERFTREKTTRAFPRNAVAYCLAEAGIEARDVDCFAASWNPGAYFQSFNPVFSGRRRFMAEHLYAVPDNLIDLYPQEGRDCDYMVQQVPMPGGDCKTYFVTHHRAHAANAFFLSPFEEAAILTVDSQGEVESATFSAGRGNSIELLKKIHYPQSIGAFYAAFTELLGYRANGDEWKVMALAALADWDNPYYKILKEDVVRLLPGGEYEFDLTYFNGFNHDLPHIYSPKLAGRFGPARLADAPLEDSHYAIAAAVQRVTEEIVFHMLAWLQKETGMKNLAVSGGVFMNSVMNGKLLGATPFSGLYVSSCPDDSGNAIGAAYYVHNQILGNPRGEAMARNDFGPSYDDKDVLDALIGTGLAAKAVNDAAGTAAELMVDGKILGWFQGRMEFGQRALGQRSIIADPRRAETKDRINAAVKFRETYRPFAPAVLAERAGEFFDIPDGVTVPFMESVYPVREDKRAVIPAVVHADGSGRVQTVEKDTAPLFHDLISSFDRLCGVPVVLNTSFNLNGEPIVCSPKNAVRTFLGSSLDGLVIGNHLVQKQPGTPAA